MALSRYGNPWRREEEEEKEYMTAFERAQAKAKRLAERSPVIYTQYMTAFERTQAKAKRLAERSPVIYTREQLQKMYPEYAQPQSQSSAQTRPISQRKTIPKRQATLTPDFAGAKPSAEFIHPLKYRAMQATGTEIESTGNKTAEKIKNAWETYEKKRDAGAYNSGDDYRGYTLKKKNEALEELQRKSAEFQASLPKTEEEKKALIQEQDELKKRQGVYQQLGTLGLYDPITNRYYHGRPEDYDSTFEDNWGTGISAGDAKENYYDTLLYDTVYGQGAWQRDFFDNDDEETSDQALQRLETLWERLGNGTIQDMAAENEEATGRQEELTNIFAGGDPYANRIKGLEKSIDLENTILDLEKGATGTGEYIPQTAEWNMNTNGDVYYTINGADDIDMSVFYANHPWLENMKSVYGDYDLTWQGNESRLNHWQNARNEYFMTDEQVETLNKLYGSGSPEEKEQARAYMDALNQYCLQRMKTAYEEEQQKENAKGPWGALEGIATIPVQLVAGAIGLAGSVAALFGNEEASDPNSDWYQLGRYVKNTREARGEEWDKALVDKFGEDWQGVGQFFNGVTYSIADNLMALATSGAIGAGANAEYAAGKGAETIIQLVMSSEATASEMLEQLNNGKDPVEAAILALGGGVIEAVTEKYSIEALLKPDVREMLGTPKQLLKYLAKNTVAESSEEVASDVLSTVFDVIVSAVAGHENEIEREIDDLKAGGMGQEDAEREVLTNRLKQLGLSAAGGALSGAILSGGRVAANAVEQAREGHQIKSEENTKEGKTGAEQLVEAAAAMDEGTQSRELAEAILNRGRGPYNIELGRLAQNILNETNEQIAQIAQDTVKEEAQRQMEEKGLGAQEARGAAEAIAKATMAGSLNVLNAEERSAITASQVAIDTARSFFADPKQRLAVEIKQLAATAEQRSLRQQVTDLTSGKSQAKTSAALPDVAESVKTARAATRREIRMAYGKATGAADEVIFDNQIVRLTRFENGNAVITGADGKEQTVAPAEVKAIHPTAAAVISFAEKHGNLMSDEYATAALQQIGKGGKAEAAQYLDDVMKIRLAGATMNALPKTALDAKAAQALYEAAQTEFQAAEEKRMAKATRTAQPGRGRATYMGAEYGTREFDEAIRNLPKQVRNQAGALAEIAVRTGMRVNYINDTEHTDVYGYYDEDTGEITINLAGEDEKGAGHHLLVTAGHEMTHWLENHSREGYAQLREFVVNRLRTRGVNVEQQLMATIDNFNAVMGGDKQLDLNGAMAEIVANACDQVLGTRETAEELARVNPSLFDKVKTFVKDFVARIRQAVGGMNLSYSRESAALMNETEEIAHIWLEARREATGETVETKSGESDLNGGRRQYSFRNENREIISLSGHEIEEHRQNVHDMEPAATITEEDYSSLLNGDIVNNGYEYFNRQGGVAKNDVIGTVILAKSGLRHIVTRGNAALVKAMTIPAIKPTIEKGQIVHIDNNNDHKNVDSVVIASKVKMPKGNYYIGVLVSQDNGGTRGQSNRYSFHAALAIKENAAEMDPKETGSYELPKGNSSVPVFTILQDIASRNGQSGKTAYRSFNKEQLAGRQFSTRQQQNTEQQDRAYADAVERGDLETATAMLMDKLKSTEGIIPFNAPHGYGGQHKDIAQLIKNGTPEAVARAAADMAGYVPENAVLIPIPNHTGTVDDETDTMILARAIGELTGRPVVAALEGNERESRYKAKEQGRKGASAEELGFRQTEELPDGTMPIFIDNVVGSGVTAQAAEQALGGGITLAYAKSTRSQGIEGLKRATVTYDKDGNLIPLSQRFDRSKRDVRYSARQMDTAYMQAVRSGNTEEARALMEEAAKQAGYTIRAYHGTGRADRVGTVFLPERATSGPMAFFTDNREIAGNYARNKKDTSIAYDEEYSDYHTQFRTKGRGGKDIAVEKLWSQISIPQMMRIREAGKHITWDEDVENIVYDPDAKNGNGRYNDYTLREWRGNAIAALVDAWLDGGDLFGQEERFLEVLQLAGIENVTYKNPNERHEKVYDTYLKIQNPFDVSTMYTDRFLEDLERWWMFQDKGQYQRETANADAWDKNSISVDEWIRDGFSDVAEGRTSNWTRIPDGVTAYLKEKGYDGIKDRGGKHTGYGHTVWIPFSSEQVKSAETVTYDDSGKVIPLSERFSENADIRYSIAQAAPDVNQWMLSVDEKSLKTVQERNLLKQYKDLRMTMDVTRLAITEQQREIARLEGKKNPTAYDRDQLRKAKIILDGRTKKLDKLQDEIIKVTSSEGYAGMMYKQQKLMTALFSGRTADEVHSTVEAMTRELERVTKEMDERAGKLKELAQAEGVIAARTYFANAGLKKTAAKLKADMNSEMKNKDIENQLARISLKMMNGENFMEEAMDLSQLLMERTKSGGGESYILSELRGRTFLLSESQMKELKGQHRTLGDVRRELAGTGIKVKASRNSQDSTLDKVWEELCHTVPMLDPDVNDKDMLDALIHAVQSEKDEYTAQFFGDDASEKTFELVMEGVAGLVKNAGKVDRSVKEAIAYIRELSGKAEETAEELGGMAAAVQRLREQGREAKNSVNTLDNGLRDALEYFNSLTEQSEAAIWRRERVILIEQMKNEKAEALLKEQEKWKERIERDKKARDLTQENLSTRKAITTNVSRIRKLLVNETDIKNIPEHMKGLAREMLRIVLKNDLGGGRKVTGLDRKDMIDTWRMLEAWKKQDGDFDITSLEAIVDEEVQPVVAEALADIEDGIQFYNNSRGGKLVDNLQAAKNALERVMKGVVTVSNVISAERSVVYMDQRIAVEDAAEDVIRDFGEKRFKGEWAGKIGKAVGFAHKAVVSGNTTPVYFFKNLRNGGMLRQWQELERGENRNGLELQKAKAHMEALAERTGYKSWDFEKKYQVSLNGTKVEMTLENLMAMYATWKREHMEGPEVSSHMEKGGVFIDNDRTGEGLVRREKVEQKAHKVTQADMNAITGLLSQAQIDYVEGVVKYLSEDMSDLGNETSMRMYGIEKYKEKFYFPMKVWDGVKAARSDKGIGGTTENRAAHQGWSKRRQNMARNALVIGNFTDVAMQHIVEMINYNTMAPAIENMNKVLNFKVQEGEEDDVTSRTVRIMFSEAYGKEALGYLETFMKDLNGGVAQDNRKTLRERALSLFKKNAVAGSLSVAFQQPMSYIRAAMEINPAYLAKALGSDLWKGAYQEMTQYSGIAVLKDMGRFDMNFGQSAREWITPEKGKSRLKAAAEKGVEMTTILPEKMDKFTWTRMWVAVKAEQKAKNPGMDVKSEEFLSLCAERFNEVMRKTQVYDSVLVKSSNMRSQNYGLKIITSFMAEPTLSLNVLGDAIANAGQKGGKRKLAMAAATFLASAAGQALIKAAMGTGRTPDDKKTFWENFLNKYAYNFIGEVNPIGMIPGYSDLIEVLKNGELKDDAMGIFGKLKSSWDIAVGGKSKGSVWRDVEDSAGQIAQLFTNVPAKNLMRDARAIYNWFSQATYANRETSAAVLKNQLKENLLTADNLVGVINEWLGEAGYKTTNTAYYRRIYDARKAGNTDEANAMAEYLMKARNVEEKTLESNLNALTKKDTSMTEEERAAKLVEDAYGEADEYIIRQVKDGAMDADAALKLLEKQYPDKKESDLWWRVDRAVYSRETGAESVSGYYYRLKDAIEENRAEAITKAVKELLAHGVEKKNVKSKLSDWKQAYLDADANGKVKLRDALVKAYKAIGLTAQEAEKMINGWKKKSQ